MFFVVSCFYLEINCIATTFYEKMRNATCVDDTKKRDYLFDKSSKLNSGFVN